MSDSSFILEPTEDDTISKLKNKLLSYENGSHPMFVLIWNEQDHIVYLSEQMEDLIGEKEMGVHTLTWMDIFPEITVEEIQKHFRTSDQRLHLNSFKFGNKMNEECYTQGDIAPIGLHNELYYICMLSDVLESNVMKDFIVDLEKQMLSSQMTASLVHEIRNPLTSVKGFLQLVQSGIEQKEEYYKVIISEIEKLEYITNEILQLSRPKKQNKEKECIEGIIRDVVFLLETQMDMKDIAFDVHIEDNLYVDCHATQMKQVFINLFKNGVEAMERKGEIKVYAYQEKEEVLIEIMDKGKGMGEDVIAEVNSPFYTTKASGTGLGLVVTNRIIDDHQGKLKVITEENKGTVFTVILPSYSY